MAIPDTQLAVAAPAHDVRAVALLGAATAGLLYFGQLTLMLAGNVLRMLSLLDDLTCDVCGGRMVERKCKILCLNCGYTRDCSDP